MKRNHTLLACPLLAAALLLGACSDKPENVLGTEQLASLLADMNVAEVYMALEGLPGQPARAGLEETDSVKKVMRQSVLMNNGITQADFDRTLNWYGHHLDKYEEVCERSQEILEERQKALRANPQASQVNAESLWPGPLALTMSGHTGRSRIAFEQKLAPQAKGEMLEWKFNTNAMVNPLQAVIAVEYADGSTALLERSIASEGRQSVRFQIDSTASPKRVYGYLTTTQPTILILDSITLQSAPSNSGSYYEINRQLRRSKTARNGR